MFSSLSDTGSLVK